MEIKINNEIRDYTESMFFGLSLRLSVFSLLALGVAVGIYFILKPYLGIETLSWLCILGASPFAALGFINYHGMTAEQLLWAWFRTQIIEPHKLKFESTTLYREATKGYTDKIQKEKMNVKNSRDSH